VNSVAEANPAKNRRQLALAILLAATILIPRGILIARDHGPTFDENYHLYRGLLFLHGDWPMLHGIRLNGSIVWGEALLSIPAWLNDQHVDDPFHANAWSSDVPPPQKFCYVLPDRIRIETAIWKSVLFLPAVAVIFGWVRSVYSLRSAWLAVALLLVEPTLAAMIPIPTPDSFAAEAIVIAVWAVWRFIKAPTLGHQITAAATVAVALLTKPNALLIPVVAAVLALVHWLWRSRANLAAKIRSLGVAGLLTALFLWLLLLGDISVPLKLSDHEIFRRGGFLSHGIPAGVYVESIWDAAIDEQAGRRSFLLGRTSNFGWWYYFPVVATFKVPIGIGVVAAMAFLSIPRIKPRYEELPLAISAIAFGGATMAQHIDIGFRHFLPAEIFLLMLSARVLAQPGALRAAISWLAVVATAIDVALWTPDYLSYVNFPRPAPWLDISDSNLDWGQGLKELRQWIEAHPDDHRPIYLIYFGPLDQNLFDQLGPRLTQYVVVTGHWIARDEASPHLHDNQLPDHGLLIVSAVEMSALYHPADALAALQSRRPDQVIGHCLLVFDMDRSAPMSGR
jgi:hypothetical protein